MINSHYKVTKLIRLWQSTKADANEQPLQVVDAENNRQSFHAIIGGSQQMLHTVRDDDDLQRWNGDTDKQKLQNVDAEQDVTSTWGLPMAVSDRIKTNVAECSTSRSVLQQDKNTELVIISGTPIERREKQLLPIFDTENITNDHNLDSEERSIEKQEEFSSQGELGTKALLNPGMKMNENLNGDLERDLTTSCEILNVSSSSDFQYEMINAESKMEDLSHVLDKFYRKLDTLTIDVSYDEKVMLLFLNYNIT